MSKELDELCPHIRFGGHEKSRKLNKKGIYNSIRPHSAHGELSPAQFEAAFWDAHVA